MSLIHKFATFRAFARQAGALSTPYFRSEEKWKARALLAAIVVLNLAAVYMLVLINDWNRLFYDALQNKQQDVFWTQLGRFTWIAFAYIIIAVYKFYLTQLLELRWRAWLTGHYTTRWLANHAFYRMELARFTQPEGATGKGHSPDNPDQRIQEDLNLFTSYSVAEHGPAQRGGDAGQLRRHPVGLERRVRLHVQRQPVTRFPASWSGWRCCTAWSAACSPTTSAAR
jgi:putative ATP-binding cassette transporter